MDCETFEAAMMDELYGELDELTSAAVKRHASGCSRCAALLGGLRATRRLVSLPLVEMPAGLEGRILGAATEAQKVVPLRRRAARVVSVAGSWAMRPQSAMAAVFMVMLGTSLLLLRGRSSRAPASAEVTVTEHGTPAPAAPPAAASVSPPPETPSSGSSTALAMAGRAAEAKPAPAPIPTAAPAGMPQASDLSTDDLRPGKAAAARALTRDEEGPSQALNGASGFAAPPPMAQPASGAGGAAPASGRQAAKEAPSPFDAALRLYQSGRFDEAARAFDPLGAQDVNADLYAARSIREGKGCRSAVARFDRVAQRATGTPPGWDALLEGALCYRSIGDFGSARVRLTPLLTVDSHKDRARAEIDRLGQGQGQSNAAAKAARPSGSRPPAAAAAAPASAPADVGGQ